MEVRTLKRNVEQTIKEHNALEVYQEDFRTKRAIRKNSLNFDGDLLSIITETINQNSPLYNLSMQILPAKDIQNILKKEFKFFNFKVKEVEAETSKRVGLSFAPYYYMCNSNREDVTTFLEDLQNQEDIIVDNASEKIRWSTKKVPFKLKTSSNLYLEDKEYLVGNTVKTVKIDIKNNSGKKILDRPIFTIPGVNISIEKTTKLYRNIALGGNIPSIGEYKSKDYDSDNLYKIMDLNYLVGLCKVIEMCIEFLDRDPSFLYNKEYSYYNKYYTTEDMFKLLDIGYLTKHKEFIDENMMFLICECILAVTHMRNDELLIRKYRRDIKSEYSKAFETKKNIPEKIKKAMKNNGFLENFTYIELDELIDIDKFYLIENEFLAMKEYSNLGDFLNLNAELRFRRLGQHRATGLYYQDYKCICVDINNPQSFMHEVAHHIDYTSGQIPLSTDVDFRMLSIEYKRHLEYTLSKEEDIRVANYFRRKRDYFYTPTEIFARCFEIYLVSIKKLKSSLVPNKSFFALKNGYPELSESLLNKIKNYFEQKFNILDNANTTIKLTKQITIENVNINDKNIVENNKVEIISGKEEKASNIDNNNLMVYENELFLKIIEESIESVNKTVKSRKRKRRINRQNIDSDCGVQLSFL